MTETPPAKNKVLSPAKATNQLNAMSAADTFALALTTHATEQMEKRGLLVDDILHVLRQGFVYQAGEATTRAGVFKYAIEGATPNSGKRHIRAIVAMSETHKNIARIITIMWVDKK